MWNRAIELEEVSIDLLRGAGKSFDDKTRNVFWNLTEK